MIGTLAIERFKSIRSLSIECRKVNVFIGAPDTGKTNILEALSFLSRLGWSLPLGTSLRLCKEIGFEPLFYRQFVDEPFQVSMKLASAPSVPAGFPPLPEKVSLQVAIGEQNRRLEIATSMSQSVFAEFDDVSTLAQFNWIRFYSYTSSEQWRYSSERGDKLVTPPHGDNLAYVARHNRRVWDFLKDTLADLNWKISFDHARKTLCLAEVRENEFLSYNLDLLSDTLKRLFFYGAVVLTSESATLVLDEPDVFAFPPYPKMLGEMIAGDPSNQFFLTTHNPYFLAGLVEKTPIDKLALFLCHRDAEGATAAKLLNQQDVERVIEFGPDVFFNLDQFLTA